MLEIKYEKLSKIAQIYNGARTTRYINKENGIKTKVLSGRIENNQLTYDEENIDQLDPKFYSKTNDIIIHLADTTNILLLKEEGVLIPQNYAIIRLKEGYNPEYIYNILKSTQFQHKINKIQMGSIVKFLKVNDIRNIKIKILPKDKQEDYGKLLKEIEKKVELYNKKITLEEKYLNGLLQKELGDDYVKI